MESPTSLMNYDSDIPEKLKQILEFLKEKRDSLLELKAKYVMLQTSWKEKENIWNSEKEKLQNQIYIIHANKVDTENQLEQEIEINRSLNIKLQTQEEEIKQQKELHHQIDTKQRRKLSDTKTKLNKLQHSIKRGQAEKCILLRKCMDLEAQQREITVRNSRVTDYATKLHEHNQTLHRACEQMFSILNRLQLDTEENEIEKLRTQVESLSHHQENENTEEIQNTREEIPEDSQLYEKYNYETLNEFIEAVNACTNEDTIDIAEVPPCLQLSVSQVFLRLHALTLQKNSLLEELDKYKALYEQLRRKMWDREQKILTVKEDLQATWGLVSKLKEQHDEIHTSESLRRYDLQEKRLLLNRLKEELRFSREQWKTIQEKNDASALEWQRMREEFTKRRQGDSTEASASLDSDESPESPVPDSNFPLIYFALVDFDSQNHESQ